MWRGRKRAIVRKGVLLAGGLLVLLPGCRRSTAPPPRPPEKPKPSATFSGAATGIELRLDDAQGRPVYEVRSDASTQSQTQANVTLNDTKVTLYHEGEADIVVNAPHTKVKADTGELVMWGGVTAESRREQARFRVERLTWNYRTKRFEGTGGVTFSRPSITLRAGRITGATPLKKIDLDGGVDLTVTPERSGGKR